MAKILVKQHWLLKPKPFIFKLPYGGPDSTDVALSYSTLTNLKLNLTKKRFEKIKIAHYP